MSSERRRRAPVGIQSREKEVNRKSHTGEDAGRTRYSLGLVIHLKYSSGCDPKNAERDIETKGGPNRKIPRNIYIFCRLCVVLRVPRQQFSNDSVAKRAVLRQPVLEGVDREAGTSQDFSHVRRSADQLASVSPACSKRKAKSPSCTDKLHQISHLSPQYSATMTSPGLGNARVCTGLVLKTCSDVKAEPRYDFPRTMISALLHTPKLQRSPSTNPFSVRGSSAEAQARSVSVPSLLVRCTARAILSCMPSSKVHCTCSLCVSTFFVSKVHCTCYSKLYALK